MQGNTGEMFYFCAKDLLSHADMLLSQEAYLFQFHRNSGRDLASESYSISNLLDYNRQYP